MNYYQYDNDIPYNFNGYTVNDWPADIHPLENCCSIPHFMELAVAHINGGPLAPDIKGTVYFIKAAGGTNVYIDVSGLPPYTPAIGNNNPIGPLGFHMHQNCSCAVGDPADPFQSAGGHWNPTNQPHGNHAGDFPVLFSNNGVARMWFFTDKFTVDEIICKSIIIHQNPDDYRTQPSGDSGKRLACGIVEWYK